MDQMKIQTLGKLIQEGQQLLSFCRAARGMTAPGHEEALMSQFYSWRARSLTTIESFGDSAESLRKEIVIANEIDLYNVSSIHKILGILESALVIARESKNDLSRGKSKIGGQEMISKKVFVVHGRDESARETAARFVEKLGLEAVILHEQSSEGRTIIQKFEDYADVSFAVVLLTPDDIGGPPRDPKNLRPRARQNVIFELGYFLGALGRKRVVALYKKDVEIPSDYQGVVFIPFDEPGGWKLTLARELNAAGMDIDLNKAL